tara:strand:+ start:6444 stop:7178 length:735 start_codon:yes stop_codon:yes gene_type:complete
MKIIKSFSELSKLNRRELFERRGNDLVLKPMDRKRAISIARQLATGFEEIDLRAQPSKNEYRRAQKIIKDYYESARNKNAQIIRPRANNRKLYAEKSDLSPRFKIYPITVSNPKNELKVVKKGNKKKLKEVGQFVSYEDFYFPDKKELVLNPENETNKLLKKIDKIKQVKQINIIVGAHLTKANYDKEILADEIKRFSMQYANFQEFTRGLQVATFKNQKKKAKSNGKHKRKNSKTKKRNKQSN